MKVSALLLVLLTAASRFSAQEPPKPRLVDTFGRTPCDEFNAHASALVQETANTSGSKALVIARPDTKWERLPPGQFRIILANFQVANLEDKVDFVIEPPGSDFLYQFWIVPAGAKVPAYQGQKWLAAKPDTSKAFVYDTEDEVGECSTFVPRKFAELILSVPHSRVHVVVVRGNGGSLLAKGFADQTIDVLVNTFHVPKNRIRIFYSKQRSQSLTYAEYWFVPPKKR